MGYDLGVVGYCRPLFDALFANTHAQPSEEVLSTELLPLDQPGQCIALAKDHLLLAIACGEQELQPDTGSTGDTGSGAGGAGKRVRDLYLELGALEFSGLIADRAGWEEKGKDDVRKKNKEDAALNHAQEYLDQARAVHDQWVGKGR